MHEAVIICTRNRPADLARLLDNLASHSGIDQRLIMIVDASDEKWRRENENRITGRQGLTVVYLPYSKEPSLARQRNFGLRSLPEHVEIVHFLDDDVILEADYLNFVAEGFSEDGVVGVGGKIVPREDAGQSGHFGRFFLLESGRKGRILCSGAATPGQVGASGSPFATEWLGGCACSFRRDLFETELFDDRLTGYSLDEDLDFSYRASRRGRLLVIPAAVVHHHESPIDRSDIETYARDRMIHRYWFLEKNIQHPLRKPAFWWSCLGRLIGARLSSKSTARAYVSGYIEGMRTVFRRDHPLL
jgi:GT2 family glycosyltransferase